MPIPFAAIGLGLGAASALKGLFGGGRDDDDDDGGGIRAALLARLNARSNANFDPFKSTTFQAGLGSLRDLLQGERTKDEGRAAAVGLPGSEIGKASQAGRLQALTQGSRSLLAQSSTIDASNRNSAQNQLLALLGLQSGENQAQLSRDQRNKENRLGLLGQLGVAGIGLLGRS